MSNIQACHTTTAVAISEYIKNMKDHSLLVGPDSESEQWVS